MHYDPIKNIFASYLRKYPSFRRIFYFALNVMFLREWYVKRTLTFLLKQKKAPLKVYDAGCGFGQYTYFIATQFPFAEVYAVDVKEDQIEDCKRYFTFRNLHQCNFYVEDLTIIKHLNAFDLILSVDVMEHIENDLLVFQNFYNALKEGGLLIINTPSDQGGSDAHDKNDESFIAEHARNGYNVNELCSKLTSCGFTIDSVEYTYGTFGMLAWRIGIKIPMQLLNISKLLFILLPLYYIITFPIFFLLNQIDLHSKKSAGAGLLVVARKKAI